MAQSKLLGQVLRSSVALRLRAIVSVSRLEFILRVIRVCTRVAAVQLLILSAGIVSTGILSVEIPWLTIPPLESLSAGIPSLGILPRASVAGVIDRYREEQAVPAVRPRLSWHLDPWLLGAGAALGGIGELVPVHHQLVPAEGLDRSRIRLAIDRRVVGETSNRAAHWSDLTMLAASAYPFGAAFACAPEGARILAAWRRVLPYLEATTLNTGVTTILKRGVSRPRPYLYLPGDPGSNRGAADEGLFSFPSGHSSQSWCAASFAVVDHLLSRPRASWKENAAVGFLGGALAAGTGYLRVRAGQHFPTDVMAGAAVGSACGAAVPLVHDYVLGNSPVERPGRSAWFSSLAGIGAGVFLVLALGPTLAPG